MFVPIENEEQWKVCTSREHNPPNNMVISRPMKWVCPACGASVMIIPTTTICEGSNAKIY